MKVAGSYAPVKPTIKERGKGHGCDEWYLTEDRSTSTPASSLTSLATFISNVSPTSRKPAKQEKRPGFHLHENRGRGPCTGAE